MKYPTETMADLRIKLTRTKKGTLATCRLKTSEEVRWHRITLPHDVPAYYVWEQAAQAALAKFAGQHGAQQTSMQMMLG